MAARTSNKPLTILEWKLLQWMAKPYGNPPASYIQSFRLIEGKLYAEKDFTSGVAKAAAALIERGWTWEDEYRNRRLNDLGMAAANELPKPVWKPPAPPKLEDRDWELLASLNYQNREASYKRAWVTPLECGGVNGSYHSVSLTKLVRHGYAEGRKGLTILTKTNIVPEPDLRARAKGSRSFRITDEGTKALRMKYDS